MSINDRIREAHEKLIGIGRTQNLQEALEIYHEEADINGNVLAFNALGKIFSEGIFIPTDIKKV